jgi:uncharacterized caspase-like protein
MVRTLHFCLRLIALLSTLAVAQAQGPAPRMALVIGNAEYEWAPLRNPVHDAEAMAKSLIEAGFKVMLKTDADQAGMEKAIRAFGKELKETGSIDFFYFSGHGAQINGENYLLPVGDSIERVEDIKTGAVTATQIVDAMAKAHTSLNIVILDACSTNPLDPKGARGLSRIDSNASLFVSYATSPGAIALDGQGSNSPYTKYLAQSISLPNLAIENTFRRTLKGVYQETRGEQTPWISSTFFGDFVFRPTAAVEEVSTAQSEEAAEAEPIVLTGVYRVSGTNADGSNYRGMLALWQKDDNFDFTWWIGNDVFHETGHFAGRMLVVNWGDKHPVIYDIEDDGTLDGEWADGSATDGFEPVALAATEEADSPEGEYTVDGRNPVGQKYSGTVTIAKDGDGYSLSWEVGDSSYTGEGKLQGNLLIVDWAGSSPIVYAIEDDGRLTGLWDAGKGEETLTPQS